MSPETQYSSFVREGLEVDMKIGVSGASGHVGRAIVSELLRRTAGHEVVGDHSQARRIALRRLSRLKESSHESY
jgi:nucleoside-diphosphate-sugar epimerase